MGRLEDVILLYPRSFTTRTLCAQLTCQPSSKTVHTVYSTPLSSSPPATTASPPFQPRPCCSHSPSFAPIIQPSPSQPPCSQFNLLFYILSLSFSVFPLQSHCFYTVLNRSRHSSLFIPFSISIPAPIAVHDTREIFATVQDCGLSFSYVITFVLVLPLCLPFPFLPPETLLWPVQHHFRTRIQ